VCSMYFYIDQYSFLGMTDVSVPKCTCGSTRGTHCDFVPPTGFQYELGYTQVPDYYDRSSINRSNSHACICGMHGPPCLASSGTHRCICKYDPEKCMLDWRYSTMGHDCICDKLFTNQRSKFYNKELQAEIDLIPETLDRLTCRAVKEHHSCICTLFSSSGMSLYEKCASDVHHCSCEVVGYLRCRVSLHRYDHRCICHTGQKCYAPSVYHRCMCRTDVACRLAESHDHSYKHECRCDTDKPCIATSWNHQCVCGTEKQCKARVHH